MPFQKVFIHHLSSTDPFFNLSVEDYLFRHLDLKQGEFLFLTYENSPSVVIGHFQNPWRECNLEAMKKDFVKLVRRMSGGGTVYHDLGNLNYSIINLRSDTDLDFNGEILKELLILSGVSDKDIFIDPKRHDIFINGKKISGSAFKNIKDRSYHHGTLLINSPLEKLMNYLDSSIKDRISGKFVPSKKSPVTSLEALQINVKNKDLLLKFNEIFKSKNLVIQYLDIDYDELLGKDQFLTVFNNLQSDEFIFSETPLFTFNEHEVIEKGMYKDGPKKGQKFTI